MLPTGHAATSHIIIVIGHVYRILSLPVLFLKLITPSMEQPIK
jgi:hypothetical protein